MKKSIKLAAVALLSVIMLIFSIAAYATSEDAEGTIPSTTEEQLLNEQPVEAMPGETPSVKEQPAEEEQPTEEPLVTAPPATKQPATMTPVTKQPATVPPTTKQPPEATPVTVNSLSTSSIRLNLYEKKDVSSTILYVFADTDRVIVLDQSDDWLNVDFNGLQGYIAMFEPMIAKEPAPSEEPAAKEGLDADESSRPQETPMIQEDESSAEPDATKTAVVSQEPTVTEEPAKLDLSIESDTEAAAATSQEPLETDEPVDSGLTAEPAAEEDVTADQKPEVTEEPVLLDLTVEPDAVPANVSVKIHADTSSSVLHYGDVITLAGTIDGENEANYTLQWQQRDVGGAWRDLEGENMLQYSFTLTKQNEHSEWKLDVRTNQVKAE